MTAKDFLTSCISCGTCVEACPFLSEYGTPDTIIKEKPLSAFLCTNCKACDSLCPQLLSPSEALRETKYKEIKEGNLSEKIKTALRSAEAFAKRGHRFPLSYYQKADIVFWPGCSLSGSNPKLVKDLTKTLSSILNRKIGLVLDCCFDPLYQMGDIDGLKRGFDTIKERIKKHEIKHIITGCGNCKKIFSLFMPEIKISHILNILINEDNSVLNLPPFLSDNIFVHHPCPAFRFDETRQAVTKFIKNTSNYQEIDRPHCCGLGGGLSSIDNALSNKFNEKIIEKAKNASIITYCMGCKNYFLKKGKEAYHMLEFVGNAKPLKQPISSTKKWVNRFILSAGQHFKSKKVLTAFVVIILIVLTTYLRKEGIITPEAIMGYIKEHKVTAPLLFILIYAIGPSLFIPSLPLTLGAGFLWGPFWGVLFSITGATVGASVAFLISRYIIGDIIKEKFSYSRWQWLKEKVERHGWKAVAFSRLVPIFPFPVLNYIFGITPIPFIHYLWSTFVFMLPACIAYVAFGSSMGELILKGNIKGLITGILIATIALILPLAFKPIIKKVFPPKDAP
jgi:uncharacterized membrane protein YdjX (TVP38/TMEM64 family)/Fe-S oxidoreductase